MNCPICHAEMVLDYKIKIEMAFSLTLSRSKEKNDQKKVKSTCLSLKVELYATSPSGEKE